MGGLEKSVAALFWTCVVQGVMAFIFIGAVIDATERDSFLWSAEKVLAVFPSLILALLGVSSLANSAKHTKHSPSIYVIFALLSFGWAICEGFFARLSLHGVQQAMFGAYAALQTAVTIECLVVWQFKRKHQKSMDSSSQQTQEQQQPLNAQSQPQPQPQPQPQQFQQQQYFYPVQNQQHGYFVPFYAPQQIQQQQQY